MIKTLISINQHFLNTNQRKKIIYFFFYSLIIPFLEVLSLATLSGLILLFIDYENSIKLIPSVVLQETISSFDRIYLLKILGFFVFFAILIKNLIIFFYYYFEKKITKSLIIFHSKILLEKYLNLPYDIHIGLNSEEIENDILHQSKNISGYIFSTLGVIKDTVISVFFLTSLLIINLKASLLIIFFSLIAGLLFQFVTGSKIRKFGSEVRFLQGTQIKIAKAISSGIKSIILFSKKNFFQDQFNEKLKKKEEINLIYELIQKIPRILIEVLFILIVVLMLFFLFNDLSQVKSFLPFLVFLTLIAVRMIPLFSNLLVVVSSLKFLKPTVDIMIRKIKENNFPVNKISKISNKDFNLENINVKNLSFKYSNNKDLILDNINFELEKNKIYCLVGQTGCGKSTLMDIILGLLNPTQGEIVINNKIQLQKNDEYWYKKASYVPQETFLLNETFKNNICFAEDKNKIDEEKFNQAIKLSCLEDVYLQLKNSGDYNIGDRGLKLSGGQRQRVGLARALYHDKSLIALDEATSALDRYTEEKILKNLHTIKNDKILILISHRENTIKSCDEVISLKNGKVVFKGNSKDYI